MTKTAWLIAWVAFWVCVHLASATGLIASVRFMLNPSIDMPVLLNGR